MHDMSDNQTENNNDDCTGFTCVNSEETDKVGNSRDLVSVFHSPPHSLLFLGCNSRHKQTTTAQVNNEPGERYNPGFGAENTGTNQALNLFKSQHSREAVKNTVPHTDLSGEAVNNFTSSGQAGTEIRCSCGHEPCVTDKLSVQSKCWSQLKLHGIIPYDANDRMRLFGSTSNLRSPRRLEIVHSVSVDESVHREPVSLPITLKFAMNNNNHPSNSGGAEATQNVSSHSLSSRESDDDEPACRSNDYGFMRCKPPRSLSLDLGAKKKKTNASSKPAPGEAQCHSNESSPMTISSGYESDSIVTREADIDTMFFKQKPKKTDGSKPQEEVAQLTDYFSMSDTQGAEGVPKENFKPDKKTGREKSGMFGRSKGDKHAKRKDKHTKQKKQKQDREKAQEDVTVFSNKERQNYKLTKVARTMFEIIHDLQLDDASPDGKKKNRKKRRNSPELNREVNTPSEPVSLPLPVTSVRLEPSCDIPSPVTLVPVTSQVTKVDTSAITPQSAEKTNEELRRDIWNSFANHEPGRVIVKCLRRPLGSDPVDFNRCLPHSDSARVPGLNNAENYDDQEQPTGQQVDWNKVSFFKNNGNVSSVPISQTPGGDICDVVNSNWTCGVQDCTPYATTRLPGCQTPLRNRDDHVYETIPGDEFLYEELMRMKRNGMLPKLRKIPDFPGAFAPYYPPALPARNDNRVPLKQLSPQQGGPAHILSPPLPSIPPPQSSHQNVVPQSHGCPIQSNAPQQQRHQPQPIKQQILNNNNNTSPSLMVTSHPAQKPQTSQTRPQGKFRPREAFESTCQSRPLPGVPVRGRSEARDARQGNGSARLRVQSQPPLMRNKHTPQQTQPNTDNHINNGVVHNTTTQRGSCCVLTRPKDHFIDSATYRSRSVSWDGYGSFDTIRRERERQEQLRLNMSVSNVLEPFEGIDSRAAKRRENFYFLLSNRQSRADFSKSLELETRLLSMSYDPDFPPRDYVDEDGYTTMDGVPESFGVSDAPQFLQSTYV